MSYLDTPRLVFSGQFQADPSTVNNDPEHFDDSRFLPNYDERQTNTSLNGWWNPTGSGAWRFIGCVVTQVFYRDGSSTTDPTQDPIIGASINDPSVQQIGGKLVDLDSQQQMVSQLWGFPVSLGNSSQDFGFTSEFQVAAFADIWARLASSQSDTQYGTFYQSVLNVTTFAGDGGSRYLKELMLTPDGVTPQQLSIRFNVDIYDDNFNDSSGFTLGRVAGAIGPYQPSEPLHFVAKRALQPAQASSPLNTAYAQLVGDVLTLDLGNSLPNQDASGAPLSTLGVLQVALLPGLLPGGQGAQPVLLGNPIPYTGAGWYGSTAGIFSVQLDDTQAGQAAGTPLGVVQVNSDNTLTPLLAEAGDGMWLRADEFVFRLSPGDSVQTTFYATAFGQPIANLPISLGYDPTNVQGQANGPNPKLPGPAPVAQPESAFTFQPSTVNTLDDGTGTATVTFTAADPQNPRGYIDGQVYGVNYGPGPAPPAPGSASSPSQLINPLVFNAYQASGDPPDWTHDVQPIFQQYANLYPVMRQFVQLDDYDSVVANKGPLQTVFNLPVTDTHYMPVTRDLSPAKREMILSWLAQTPPLQTRGKK